MADDKNEIPDEPHASPNTAPLDGKPSALVNTLSASPSTLLDRSPPSLSEAAPAKTLALESQPMTTTSSTSSALPAQSQPTMDEAGPSPYGTRSRNRGGTARINYAEDREMDMDYDWITASKKPRDSSTSASSTNLQPEDNDSAGVSTRRRSLTTAMLPSASKGVNSAVPKDQIPGLSSFPVHPEPGVPAQQTSKKRKAPGAAPASHSTPSATLSATSSKNVSRKAATATSTNSSQTTNMLSFDDSKGCLKNGGLRADDGTVLCVNGMYH